MSNIAGSTEDKWHVRAECKTICPIENCAGYGTACYFEHLDHKIGTGIRVQAFTSTLDLQIQAVLNCRAANSLDYWKYIHARHRPAVDSANGTRGRHVKRCIAVIDTNVP